MNQCDKRVLQKIVMFCERIAHNLAKCGDFDTFCQEHLYQDACCTCVIQIGELVGALSEETKSSFGNIPWRLIKDTRNFYVHKYGDIEVDKFWVTLEEDIPVLCNECKKILSL